MFRKLAFSLSLVLLITPALALSQDRVESLLAELSNAAGPSGFEGPVRAILEREMRAAGLEITKDGLGSIIGVLRGPADGPKIMLAAHMDEVGGVVRYITPEGMVKFQLSGGVLDQALADQRWTIMTAKGSVMGISGLKSTHVTPPEERTRVTPREDVFIDVGATNKEEAEALGIRAGDGIVPTSTFQPATHGRYIGKALDDRVGCVMMIETLRRIKEQNLKLPATIYFVGTVQEEVGLRGAHTAAAAINPDLGLSLEAGIAADHPGGRADYAQERLGGGPVLYLVDAQMFVNMKLRDFIEGAARKAGITIQTEVTAGGAEDAAELQRLGAGRPSANYAVPTRYLHTHNSMIQRSDLDQSIALLLKILPELNAATVKELAQF